MQIRGSSLIFSGKYADWNERTIWNLVIECSARADPESFVRGVQRLFYFLFIFLVWWGEEEGSKYHYKWAIVGLPAKRHSNGVSLAGRWWPNIECWISSFVIFQGIQASIATKPFIFVIFQRGGGGGGRSPLWIRAWLCQRRYINSK